MVYYRHKEKGGTQRMTKTTYEMAEYIERGRRVDNG